MKLDTAMEDRTRVLQTVVAAAAIAFALDTALAAIAGPLGAADVLGRLVGYAILVPLYLAIGWWLGTRAWPKRGAALTRRIIRRRIALKRLIFICDRPDAPRSLPRRIWEVVGFAAGLSVLGIAALMLVRETVDGLLVLLMPLAALWGAFVIIPYWMLSRLGLRTVDPVRWTIIPIGRRYAERARVSNGALVLLGAGALFNILFRAGASGTEAVAGALAVVLRTIITVLVIAAAAVAYYHRHEFALARKLEAECIEMGVRDGRGMSDGDFLPRLPPVKG
ncbi:MAG TPA: hypothetical protein VFH78_04680 [Candidatus Thermoplasmatota archaeon]|nr:hypothetical protein [Candidatus Thermoplasmatota archaeon]